MSVGNALQTVVFDDNDLVLVLGENLDMGGNDNRNGTGKTTILNALSYSLFGTALTNIRKENLINKTNEKGMYVKVHFELNGKEFKIERGRKPNLFKIVVNNEELDQDESDEAQGDSRQSQQYLEKELGMSHSMFKNIIALNTYTTPFLSMKGSEQREFIEQLLGITKLSEKAEILKALVKDTKDAVKEEEFRIKAMQQANINIENNINSTILKSNAWEKSHSKTIDDLTASLETLSLIDIDVELEMHKVLKDISVKEYEVNSLKKDLTSINREISLYTSSLNAAKINLSKIVESKECPTCGQGLTEDHAHLNEDLEDKVKDLEEKIKKKQEEAKVILTKIESIDVPTKPVTFYRTLDEVYQHKTSIDTIANALDSELRAKNPHLDHIELLKTSLTEVDFDQINKLVSTRDHQEFLLKLLTSKDSFIRKKIIDQNLAYLNNRLTHYLVKMGLPHDVKFMSDLEVHISEHDRELDFDNLSRGERTRLILSMCWSFRDVFESLNFKINMMYVDELIDNGLDTSGVEAALSVLKHMARDQKRNVFLVSHREELLGRVDTVLRVTKEGGFTSFSIEE